jgi:hypothetical protein
MNRPPTSRSCVALLGITLGTAPVAVGFGAGGPEHCADHFKLKGPCFTVHGRLRLYQGNPLVRIWPIGSHRLLGVATVSHDPENPKLPFPLNQGLDFETAYIGDYTVCPFGPDVPGEMRYVCVESIAHLEKRKD